MSFGPKLPGFHYALPLTCMPCALYKVGVIIIVPSLLGTELVNICNALRTRPAT